MQRNNISQLDLTVLGFSREQSSILLSKIPESKFKGVNRHMLLEISSKKNERMLSAKEISAVTKSAEEKSDVALFQLFLIRTLLTNQLTEPCYDWVLEICSQFFATLSSQNNYVGNSLYLFSGAVTILIKEKKFTQEACQILITCKDIYQIESLANFLILLSKMQTLQNIPTEEIILLFEEIVEQEETEIALQIVKSLTELHCIGLLPDVKALKDLIADIKNNQNNIPMNVLIVLQF